MCFRVRSEALNLRLCCLKRCLANTPRRNRRADGQLLSPYPPCPNLKPVSRRLCEVLFPSCFVEQNLTLSVCNPSISLVVNIRYICTSCGHSNALMFHQSVRDHGHTFKLYDKLLVDIIFVFIEREARPHLDLTPVKSPRSFLSLPLGTSLPPSFHAYPSLPRQHLPIFSSNVFQFCR